MENKGNQLCQQNKDYETEELRNKKFGQSMATWNDVAVMTSIIPGLGDPIPKELLMEMEKQAKNADA